MKATMTESPCRLLLESSLDSDFAAARVDLTVDTLPLLPSGPPQL